MTIQDKLREVLLNAVSVGLSDDKATLEIAQIIQAFESEGWAPIIEVNPETLKEWEKADEMIRGGLMTPSKLTTLAAWILGGAFLLFALAVLVQVIYYLMTMDWR